MKIVFLDVATVGELPNIQKFKELGDFTSYEFTTKEQVVERISGAEIVITNKVVIDEQTITASPNLKLICVAATGTNNIDLKCAEKHGIAVKNVAGYSTDSVAQITIALLMELMCRTSHFNNYVQSGDYCASKSFTLLKPAFHELKAKRYGIVGLGNIGRKVAKIVEAFDAEVVYHSTSGKNSTSDYKQVDMDELLTTCDVISIHAPLNEQTLNLFDYEKLCRMKKTALIINVGRGGIINESDLVRALNENKIAAAGIDVFTVEPMEKNSPYMSLKNSDKLVATPHIAWASVEARTRLVDMIIDNISASYPNK